VQIVLELVLPAVITLVARVVVLVALCLIQVQLQLLLSDKPAVHRMPAVLVYVRAIKHAGTCAVAHKKVAAEVVRETYEVVLEWKQILLLQQLLQMLLLVLLQKLLQKLLVMLLLLILLQEILLKKEADANAANAAKQAKQANEASIASGSM
jgi:hypothetical protein